MSLKYESVFLLALLESQEIRQRRVRVWIHLQVFMQHDRWMQQLVFVGWASLSSPNLTLAPQERILSSKSACAPEFFSQFSPHTLFGIHVKARQLFAAAKNIFRRQMRGAQINFLAVVYLCACHFSPEALNSVWYNDFLQQHTLILC